MSPILSVALGGIQRGTKGVQTNADNIANFNTDGYRSRKYDAGSDTVSIRDPNFNPHAIPQEVRGDLAINDVDLAREFVELKTNENGIKANAAVVKVAQDTLGELLDILAN